MAWITAFGSELKVLNQVQDDAFRGVLSFLLRIAMLTVEGLFIALLHHCGNEGLECADGLSATHLPGAP